jgi:hypothetical protein
VTEIVIIGPTEVRSLSEENSHRDQDNRDRYYAEHYEVGKVFVGFFVRWHVHGFAHAYLVFVHCQFLRLGAFAPFVARTFTQVSTRAKCRVQFSSATKRAFFSTTGATLARQLRERAKGEV